MQPQTRPSRLNILAFCSKHLSEPKSNVFTPKRDDEHPRPFHMRVPQGLFNTGAPRGEHERGGDARRKFRIKPLKETNVGVVRAFFDPQKDHKKHRPIYIFILLRVQH